MLFIISLCLNFKILILTWVSCPWFIDSGHYIHVSCYISCFYVVSATWTRSAILKRDNCTKPSVYIVYFCCCCCRSCRQIDWAQPTNKTPSVFFARPYQMELSVLWLVCVSELISVNHISVHTLTLTLTLCHRTEVQATSFLNDIIWRSLGRAKIQSTKEQMENDHMCSHCSNATNPPSVSQRLKERYS